MLKKRNHATTHNFCLPVPDELLPMGDIVNGIIAACIKDILYYKTDMKQEPDYCHSCFDHIFDWYSSVQPSLSDEHKYELTLYTLDCVDTLFNKEDELRWYFTPEVTTLNVCCRLYKSHIKLIVTYFYNEMNHGQTHLNTGTYV